MKPSFSPTSVLLFLLIASLAITVISLPIPRATATNQTTLLQPAAMAEIRGDGSHPMLNLSASAGNDSDVTFNLFGHTYQPVLKAIYLQYTIPPALAGTVLCLAARVMSVTNNPALTIQTVDAPLVNMSWAALAAAPGGNLVAYSSFVAGQVVFYPAGQFPAGPACFVIAPAMVCPGNSTIQVPEPEGAGLYGSPPMLAPAGSELNASQLGGLVASLQAGNLTGLVNVGSLDANVTFLQGIFNQQVFSNFGLGRELNSTITELGNFTGGGKVNNTLGTIGGFVNSTGAGGNGSNSSIGGLLGEEAFERRVTRCLRVPVRF